MGLYDPNRSSVASNIHSHSSHSVSAVGDDIRNAVDMKRLRRMISRRESARRCRIRKERHLANLESQVEQQRKENTALSQQLTDATQRYREAETNCQVLNVLYLRAKEQLENEMARSRRVGEEREEVEIVQGREEWYRHSKELLEEKGLQRVVGTHELVESSRVRETGFVWMKRKASPRYIEDEARDCMGGSDS